MQKDPMQVIYHLEQTMRSQNAQLVSMQKDLSTIKIDIAVMKQTGQMPRTVTQAKVERLKDTAAGGGIGAVLIGAMVAVMEYFKTH